ncbi:MAG TPA: FAD-dependent monooxygenase [Acidimicrobiales bacterium]|nr:FAD-dependent monooxygenase [Acidimicrobiales bacterium]
MPTDTAVVVGASMGGLVATRVLSERFENVVVIERDELPESADSRKGVPQGRHVHALLPSGQRVLDEMLPGLTDELLAEGAVTVSTDGGVKWWQQGGYRSPCEAPPMLFCSRPMLERAVRRRVEKLPNVEFMAATATGLVAADGRVRGALVRRGEEESPVDAGLVVDASGRAGQLSRWLEAAGYPTPGVEQVHVDIQYTTRLYKRSTDGDGQLSAYFVLDVDRMCGGAAFPIENDQWILTLAGYHGLRADPDEQSFLAFAESLPCDDLAAIIRSEEPLSPFFTHRFPCSQRRRFDKLSRHLPGALAIGDSICSFNPLYGQGMSSAALQGQALAQSLDRTGPRSERLPEVFYKSAAKVIANPWSIAVGGDFTSPQTTGPKPPMVDLINRYIKRLAVAAQQDEVVAAQFVQVANLLASPPSLLKPSIAYRVWRGSRPASTGGAG